MELDRVANMVANKELDMAADMFKTKSSSSLSWLLKPPLIAVHYYFSFEGIVSLIDTGPSNNGYNNGLLCILRLPKNPI